jgi:myo-inositol-1(or 4)-monophosphatase
MLPATLQILSDLVSRLAERELVPRFHCQDGNRKADGSLVTEADIVMQTALIAELEKHWPGIGVLGEEMSVEQQQAALDRADTGTWCVDPLDGTSNFSVGIPYYAVSVALLKNNRIEMGVVYDPSRKECFAAARGQGAWLNNQPLQPQKLTMPLARGVALVDLKRLPAELAGRLAATPPYSSQRSFGAVALDWCWLAAGRCHVYLHGKQKLWDYAAGSLILSEAGGMAATLQHENVFALTLQPRSAAAALDPEIFAQWKAWLGISLVQLPLK